MSKGFGALVSLDGLEQAKAAFTRNVAPVDVVIGAVAQKLAGPMVQKHIISKLAAWVPSVFGRPDVAKVSAGVVVGAAAFIATGGKGRGPGILVGAVGAPVVEVIGEKLAAVLPLGALVEYDGYGMLTQDSTYGILTRDNQYGADAYGEPTEYGMAELSAYSQANSEGSPEGDEAYA
ncbi:MAG: hypothetical protein KA310_03445 [Pseudomonadales bacterium]|nr:hypothetical protein [Pseudomonadales bacterium]